VPVNGIENDLRALRIIAIAFLLGPANLLAVAIVLRSDPEGLFHEDPGRRIITWVSLFVATAAIAASLLLPRPRGAEIGKIRGFFIMRLAWVEGGALFGSVAYLLEGDAVAVGVAAACMGAMATLFFPTRERIEALVSGPA
jgi:hypothetical protein